MSEGWLMIFSFELSLIAIALWLIYFWMPYH
jgi:hypothetical protein